MCRMAATCVEAEPDGAIGSFHGCKKLEESNARACVCENCPYKLLAVRAMAPIDWVATDRGGRGSNEIPACTAPTACAGEQRTLSKRRTIHHCIWLARERQRERERERLACPATPRRVLCYNRSAEILQQAYKDDNYCPTNSHRRLKHILRFHSRPRDK